MEGFENKVLTSNSLQKVILIEQNEVLKVSLLTQELDLRI